MRRCFQLGSGISLVVDPRKIKISKGPDLFRLVRSAKLCTVSHRNPFIKVSDEVRDAVKCKKPVVALESAIYTHGFPYPENTALASHLESVVRHNGGVPATIGVLGGVARVGLDANELSQLTASAGKPDTRKVSRRDLGYICGLGVNGRKFNGGTTVSGTMVLARQAGIQVFATGGIGGVHRGAELSMDISADLTELGRTQMVIISSGCKSFLDIPRTLEYLETQGVGVMTFADGRDGAVNFPAFWTRDSGVRSPFTVHDEREAATVMHAQTILPVRSGLLLANPVPAEHSIPKHEIDAIIAQAIAEAKAAGSIGSDNTPFILKRIREITGGGSVMANRALIESNVARGTRVAVELSDLMTLREVESSILHEHSPMISIHSRTSSAGKSSTTPSRGQPRHPREPVQVVVAGSLAMDLSCDFDAPNTTPETIEPQNHTSNPAIIKQSLGGVGRNITTALHLLGVSAQLYSKVGSDLAGSTALKMAEDQGLILSGLVRSGNHTRTAQYVAVNDARKDLVLAMADMSLLQTWPNDHERESKLTEWRKMLASTKPKWLVTDANWDPSTLVRWLGEGRKVGAKLAFEPVSTAKSKGLFAGIAASRSSNDLPMLPNAVVDVATPNALELISMYEAAQNGGLLGGEDWFHIIDSIGLSSSGSRNKFISLTNAALTDQGIPQRSIQLLPFIPCIVTTLGSQGVMLTQVLPPGDDRLTSLEAAPYILSRSTNGNNVVGGVYMRLFPPVERAPKEEIVSVNGVGDTFLGALIAGLSQSPSCQVEDLIDIAQTASVYTLRSMEAVSPEVSSLQAVLANGVRSTAL
ncbi:MAG: hypothetical protein Q9163_001033 [Psora crenata]